MIGLIRHLSSNSAITNSQNHPTVLADKAMTGTVQPYRQKMRFIVPELDGVGGGREIEGNAGPADERARGPRHSGSHGDHAAGGRGQNRQHQGMHRLAAHACAPAAAAERHARPARRQSHSTSPVSFHAGKDGQALMPIWPQSGRLLARDGLHWHANSETPQTSADGVFEFMGWWRNFRGAGGRAGSGNAEALPQSQCTQLKDIAQL